jgi:hypothetical protein
MNLYRPEQRLADALEMARCAQVNFDNLVHQNPILKRHPYYLIARQQLDAAVAALEDKPGPGPMAA